jgi:hypothetical protein
VGQRSKQPALVEPSNQPKGDGIFLLHRSTDQILNRLTTPMSGSGPSPGGELFAVVVSEPSSVALMAVAMLGLVAVARRRAAIRA